MLCNFPTSPSELWRFEWVLAKMGISSLPLEVSSLPLGFASLVVPKIASQTQIKFLVSHLNNLFNNCLLHYFWVLFTGPQSCPSSRTLWKNCMFSSSTFMTTDIVKCASFLNGSPYDQPVTIIIYHLNNNSVSLHH